MTFIPPDGLAGALMGAEGFSDINTILHGPGGCRFRYMRLASELHPREDYAKCPRDREFYFGIPRIPCTFLEEYDYIYGGSGRLTDILTEVSKDNNNLIVVIESPATALIGDDIDNAISNCHLEDRAFALRKHLVSMMMNEGFDELCKELIEFISPPETEKVPDTVNLIGLPILCKDSAGSIEEISRILGLMGLKVSCSIGSGASMNDVIRSSSAEYNVEIFPEFCHSTSELYASNYGIESIGSGFAPIGFDSTRDWVYKVSEITGKDPSKAMEYIDSMDKKARTLLRSDVRMATKTRGMHYSINTGGSIAYPMIKWLFEYLSMIPDSVSVPYTNKSSLFAIKDFLKEHSLDGAFDNDIQKGGLMISSGDYAYMCKLSGDFSNYIDVGFPPARDFNFRNETILGPTGAMNILNVLYNKR